MSCKYFQYTQYTNICNIQMLQINTKQKTLHMSETMLCRITDQCCKPAKGCPSSLLDQTKMGDYLDFILPQT